MSAIVDSIMLVKTPQDMGLVIRAERTRRGLDQKTLAAKVGVSRQWIIWAERGKPGLALGLLLRTLNVLGLRLTVEPPQVAAQTPRSVWYPEAAIDIDEVVERSRRRRRS